MSTSAVLMGYVFNKVPNFVSRLKNVYISGPMTGLPDFNFPAFNAAAKKLKEEGWNVCNPAEHGIVEGATRSDYLRFDLAHLSACDTIYLLPGWENSDGAKWEVEIAKKLGITIIDSTP